MKLMLGRSGVEGRGLGSHDLRANIAFQVDVSVSGVAVQDVFEYLDSLRFPAGALIVEPHPRPLGGSKK